MSSKTIEDAAGTIPMERRIIQVENVADQAGIAPRFGAPSGPAPPDPCDDDVFAGLLKQFTRIMVLVRVACRILSRLVRDCAIITDNAEHWIENGWRRDGNCRGRAPGSTRARPPLDRANRAAAKSAASS